MDTDAGFPVPPAHAQQRFELLQERLVPLWHSIEAMNQDPQTIVVVPSISLDKLDESADLDAALRGAVPLPPARCCASRGRV